MMNKIQPRPFSVTELAASIDASALVDALNKMFEIIGSVFVAGVVCSKVETGEQGNKHTNIYITDLPNIGNPQSSKFRLWIREDHVREHDIKEGDAVYVVGRLVVWSNSKTENDTLGFSLDVDSIESANEELDKDDSSLYVGYIADQKVKLEIKVRELEEQLESVRNVAAKKPLP